MAAYLLRPIVHAQARPAWMGGYLRLAQWCLNHRWWTVLGALAFFIGSLALVPLLPTGFIPPDDNSQTQVYLELPPGTKLAQTQNSAEAARQLLSQVPHIKSIYTTIGGGAAGADPFDTSGAGEPRKATLTLLLSERGQRPKKQVIEQQIRQALAALPGVRSKVGLGGSGEKYILVLTGENREALLSSAQAIERELRLIPGLGNVASSASLVRPEVVVVPDFAAAADLGVTSAAIGETLRMATAGDYDAGLAKLNLDQRQIPIVVKLQDSARQDLDTLGRLSVPGKRGPVMLAQVAHISMGSGPAVIDRYDRSRNIKFEIELSGLPLGEVTEQVKNLSAVKNLPPGIAVVEVGDAEAMGELFASFGLAMLTGVLCIYIVLVLLFKGFLHPLTILAALPLSLGGAFVGLLLANKSFSMPSLIGLIMLMGIATKNSILLVEYAIVAQRDMGMGRWEALIDACHKRARPIIMTTIAMGAGMLPLALGWGLSDPSFRSPMSIAVIGGLITSTVLSLLVIPVIYSLLEGMRLWMGARWQKLRGTA
jgi:multidrug efflux pump subunit AcrB